MTTIAWDGKTLAADTQSNRDGMGRRVQKIFRLSDGRLIGGSGEYDNLLATVHWLNSGGEKPTLTDDFSALLIERDGRCARYMQKLFPSPIVEKFTACGSGRDYAIAAMHLGKTAYEAVQIAAIYDIGTGGDIETMEVVK